MNIVYHVGADRSCNNKNDADARANPHFPDTNMLIDTSALDGSPGDAPYIAYISNSGAYAMHP